MCLGLADLFGLDNIRYIKFLVDKQFCVELPLFHYVTQVELKIIYSRVPGKCHFTTTWLAGKSPLSINTPTIISLCKP
jgi:hypothetical protein